MTTPAEPTRRFTLALTAAVASTTVAIGVTAATLFGWFRPAAPEKPAAVALVEPAVAAPQPSVVYVPITPNAPVEQVADAPAVIERVAMERRERDDRDHDRDDRDDRDDREDDDE
jgi:hypothetical protein